MDNQSQGTQYYTITSRKKSEGQSKMYFVQYPLPSKCGKRGILVSSTLTIPSLSYFSALELNKPYAI